MTCLVRPRCPGCHECDPQDLEPFTYVCLTEEGARALREHLRTPPSPKPALVELLKGPPLVLFALVALTGCAPPPDASTQDAESCMALCCSAGRPMAKYDFYLHCYCGERSDTRRIEIQCGEADK